MYLTSYNYFLQLITLERRSPYSTNQHKIMMQPADSPRSIANFFTRDGLIQNNNNKKQQQPSPPPLHQPLHRIRFSNKVRVLLVPSTKDFTRQEIDSIYTKPEDTEDIEDGIIETMLLMKRRMQTTSTSSSTPLSFDDAHEERIEMSHQTSFRGLEHLLHPMGAVRQKRGRQLLITSIVERQRTDASGKRVINADELAMISQLLSRDAIDRARAKGIEYERVEKKSYAGLFRSTPKLFDDHKQDDACACHEVPTTPPRTYYASSTSSPNLMRSTSDKANNAWSSLDSERSMRSLRSFRRRQGTSASSA